MELSYFLTINPRGMILEFGQFTSWAIRTLVSTHSHSKYIKIDPFQFVHQKCHIVFSVTRLLCLKIKQICQGSEQTWVEEPINQSPLYAHTRICTSLWDYSSCEFSRHGSKFHIGWGFNLKYYLHLTWVSNPSSLLMIYMGSP